MARKRQNVTIAPEQGEFVGPDLVQRLERTKVARENKGDNVGYQVHGNVAYILQKQPDGSYLLRGVNALPDETNPQRTSRRIFNGIAAALLGGAYCKWVLGPSVQLGRAMDVGADALSNFKRLSEKAVNIVYSKMDLEEQLDELVATNEQSRPLLDEFAKAYKNQQRITEILKTLDIDYDTFSKELNTFFEQTPLDKFKDTKAYGGRKAIQNFLQKYIMRRDISSDEYVKAFQFVSQKSKELADAVRQVESELEECIHVKDPAKAERLMTDYAQLVGVQKAFRQRLKERGYTKWMEEANKEIDAMLKKEIGPDYQRYIDAFRDNRFCDYRYLAPVTTAAATAWVGSKVYRYGGKQAIASLSWLAAKPFEASQHVNRRDFLKRMVGQYGGNRK